MTPSQHIEDEIVCLHVPKGCVPCGMVFEVVPRLEARFRY